MKTLKTWTIGFLTVIGSLVLALPPTAAVPLALQGENIELAGHLGGSSEAIAVQGDYTYEDFDPELAILDISDPFALRWVDFSNEHMSDAPYGPPVIQFPTGTAVVYVVFDYTDM